MAPRSAVPSDRELQALKILWRRQRATVRDVALDLARQGEKLAYTTVLSLLQVMESKGLVGHEAVGKVYTYFPRVERDRTVSRMAREFLDTVFDGAMDEYILHAFDAKTVTPEELQRLEAMIAKAKARLNAVDRDSKRERKS